MKTLILTISGIVIAASAFISNASMSYECWSYVDGNPDKMVHVAANNNSEAVSLAWEKFKSIGVNPVSVRCK